MAPISEKRGVPGKWKPWIGGVFSVGIHIGFLVALLVLEGRGATSNRQMAVEVELVAPPPPPPAIPDDSPPPLPPPRPEPRKVVVRAPMPNREIPPQTPAPVEAPKPIFGVTEESVADGKGEVVVPVGNTVMTKDRELAKVPPPPLPPAPPPAPVFQPVDEQFITDQPRVLSEVKPEYPPLAKRMNIEGRVILRIGIDRAGKVKSVRVVKGAGYGMDENAVKAAWSVKWAPAKGSQREPVDIVITYAYQFGPDAQ